MSKLQRCRKWPISLVSTLLSFLFLMSMVPVASAYSYSKSHWLNKNQVVMLMATVKGNYLTSAKQAVSNINSATKVGFSTGTRMVRQATSQNFGKNGWEGQSAYTFLASGYTKDAVSRVNTYYMKSSYPVARMRVLWLHEFSHCWGLGHSTINTVMYKSASDAYNNGVRYLTSDDIKGINSRY